ncbi:hypothetical protein [Streptomyces sp. NPDC054865]
MTWTIDNRLPSEGRTITVVGKGGSAKSTTLAHVLRYWHAMGVPAVGHDADEEQAGSLLTWAEMLPLDGSGLGSPVYRAPAAHGLAAEVERLRPAHGLSVIDTKAWEHKAANAHYAAMRAADLVVLALYPSGMEKFRGGSIIGALDQVEAMSGRRPRVVCLLTRFNPNSSGPKEVRQELIDEGFDVLRTEIPTSEAKEIGLAHSFGKVPRLEAGSPMHQLANELLQEVSK